MKKLFLLISLLPALLSAQNYGNFRVAVYSRAFETAQMGDRSFIEPLWAELTRQVKVDKIYLETHRDLLVVDQETLDAAKAFFREKGVEVAGGITYTVSEPNRFETFCYSNPEHRQKVKEIAEHTARNFDEVILDDFFFTSCKCEKCIEAKGDRTWTDFRMELMRDAARDLVLGPARAVNPDVRVIIKYPNWYDHFAGLGFDLEAGPRLFDGIYTGTETRDPRSNQHLQAYLGYNIVRYFESLKPGGNGGGWVDPFGSAVLDRYAEQLWITLFAKARQVTLFDLHFLSVIPLTEAMKAPWQGQGTSFDYREAMQPVNRNGGIPAAPTGFPAVAGHVFEKVDSFLGELGEPVGIPSYRPYHATGEDFLHNYLGMAGLPIQMQSEFPTGPETVLLTGHAAEDPGIVEKIKGNLLQGGTVVVTSGFLEAMQGKGLDDIAEFRVSGRKALVRDFGPYGSAEKDILLPQISYLTNDSWEQVSALDGPNGWPVMHDADYGGGSLFILTVPDNFADIYAYPEGAWNRIRQLVCRDLDVRLEGPSLVSLFLYDNHTLIVESFRDAPVEVALVTGPGPSVATNLETGIRTEATVRTIRGVTESVFPVVLPPHSFRVFRLSE
ncbi:MAG: hypothetical protein R2751_02415 [Bacteroidales bacterium]